MKTLGIIPAREGSKGIRDKNVSPVLNRPLIYWTIQEAKKAALDRVIISTDSERYRSILEQYGENLFPFIRPEKLGKDDSSSIEVILHALKELEKLGEKYEIVVLLEPTSPIRTAEQINEALERLRLSKKYRALVSVAPSHKHHPFNAFEERNDGALVPFGTLTGHTAADPDYPKHVGRQAMRPALFPTGDLYISYVDTLRKKKTFYHSQTLGYHVPAWQDPEVDDPADLVVVGALMKARNEGKI